MAQLDFYGIGISQLTACVPKNTIYNRKYTEFFSAEVANAIVDKTGIEERRFAEAGVCASDICFQAAQQLFLKGTIQKEEIKVCVFVTQTPDYRMPGNAVLLQERLGLGKDVIAFDINIGCSGFVYGLSTVYSLVQALSDGKALLLVGETRSRVYSPKDRKTAFLFGDAGIACIIEKGEHYGDSYFDLYTDGGNADLIKMDAGGYRNPSSAETQMMKVVDDDGNERSQEHGYMDGGEVFNVVLQNIPKSIKQILLRTNMNMESLSNVVLHQANKFMNDHLVKKLRIDSEKVLSNVDRFGNTSSVSIPLAMVTELPKKSNNIKGYTLMSGFGVGMSWANALIKLGNTEIGGLIEC